MIASPVRVWDPSDPAIAAELLRRNLAGESYADIGREFGGLPKDTLRAAVRRARRRGLLVDGAAPTNAASPASSQPSIRQTGLAGGGLALESPASATVRSLDDLLAACAVDLTRWQVARYVVNRWESAIKGPDGEPVVTPLYQIKAWLEPIPGVGMARELIAGLIADLAERAPVRAAVNHPAIPDSSDRHMLEVCIMDLHAGAYVWGEECGSDYDGDISADLARMAVAQLVKRAAGFPIEKVVFPLGNDLAHFDRSNAGAGGTTTKGTVVDVDTRRAKMIRTIRSIAIDAIDQLRTIAPVEVILVKGNHDEDTVLALGEIVQAWYRKDPDVTIRNEPTARKYVRYGATLLGFTHGHNEKHSDLPLIMATDAPAEWAASTHREFHLGHLHRKGETVSEHSGVRVRVMPSLAAEDAWHCAQGYRHLRAAEAYIWNYETGYVGHFSASLPGSLGKAA